MTSLVDILRQLHLVVEEVVSAEHQASEEYGRSLRAQVLYEVIPRIVRMLEERQR